MTLTLGFELGQKKSRESGSITSSEKKKKT